MYVQNYKDFIVWQKARILVKRIFLLTSSLPQSEIHGLISQMRRAAVAIPSNIAEGYGRHSTQTYIQFLKIALGSALELEAQLILTQDLDFAASKDIESTQSLLSEIIKMLHVMINKVSPRKLIPKG